MGADASVANKMLTEGPRTAMTSWVQSDGPHVVYSDANGNVNQLWYTISTGHWAAQSLMNVPSIMPVGPGSAMMSWVQSDGPHVIYAFLQGWPNSLGDSKANMHLQQLSYTIATEQWAVQDLTLATYLQ
jgi:hypothetical protein